MNTTPSSLASSRLTAAAGLLIGLMAFAGTGCGPTPSGTDGGTDAATGGDGAGGALSCSSYCTTIMTNCTAANAQYPDMASCMAECATFPMGTAADTSGNTLGCRTYHGGAPAMSAPATHCAHAGPGGDTNGGMGTCGTNCQGFCQVAMATCPMAYANVGACMTACAGYADTQAYSTGATSGNTLACRQYHLAVASSSAAMAAIHCAHITGAMGPCSM